MTEHQAYLLKLLREIDFVCRKYDLRYVMAGGSLIGVLRHEGFVPWDDDVDLMMPRKDWEIFREVAPKELASNYIVRDTELDREYTNSFPRLADTDACCIHKHQIIGKDKPGMVIDIFTLDPIPDSDEAYDRYRRTFMLYSELVNNHTIYGNRWGIGAGEYLKWYLCFTFLGKNRTLKKLEKEIGGYKEEDCSRFAMRWGGSPFLFEKDKLFPTRDAMFEDLLVKIPNCSSDYLIWHYGDEWTYIPPHEEQMAHEAVSMLDTSYQEVMDEAEPILKSKGLKFKMLLRKLKVLGSADIRQRLRDRKNVFYGEHCRVCLMGAVSELETSLEELLEKRDYKTLSALFADYYTVQMDRNFIGREDFGGIYAFYHPYLIDIPDEVYYAAVKTLFYTERIGKAWRMLKLKEEAGTITQPMKELLEDIEIFRNLINDYEHRKPDACDLQLSELMEKYPEHPSFLKMYCRRLWEQQAWEKLEAATLEALALFEQDGYFLKYQADCLAVRGESEEARRVYLQALDQTENGMILLELSKLGYVREEEVLQEKDDAAILAQMSDELKKNKKLYIH